MLPLGSNGLWTCLEVRTWEALVGRGSIYIYTQELVESYARNSLGAWGGNVGNHLLLWTLKIMCYLGHSKSCFLGHSKSSVFGTVKIICFLGQSKSFVTWDAQNHLFLGILNGICCLGQSKSFVTWDSQNHTQCQVAVFLVL